MTPLELDTGSLVGFERNDRRLVAIIAWAMERQVPLLVRAGVVAQAWRDGGRQIRLGRLLGSLRCDVVPLDDRQTRTVGLICGATGTTDVVDAFTRSLPGSGVREYSRPIPTTFDASTAISTSSGSESRAP